MTIKDLNVILGETLAELHTSTAGTKEFEAAVTRAEYETKIAKQMINAADVTLRTDKLTNRNDRIDAMVG